MCSKYLLVSLLFVSLTVQCYASCVHYDNGKGGKLKWDCGSSCTGTPSCGRKDCGNKDNMCYCDCSSYSDGYPDHWSCQQTASGWKWNNGIKNADGSYALNGTKGDGKHYVC
jgi:hypothetical protein